MDNPTQKTLQDFLKTATLFLMVLAVVLVVVAVSMYRRSVSMEAYNDTIEVQGSGIVMATPNIGRISFGHREEAADLATAQKNLEMVISNALDVLEKAGVETKDISQQNYNSYPRYEYRNNCVGMRCDGDRELVAYEVSQSINVVIREIDRAGEIVALLGNTGVTELSGPFFEIDDMSVYEQEARSLAIENARQEAEVLAKDLGVRLGKMVDFYENVYGGFPESYMTRSMDMAVMEMDTLKDVSVPVGEDEIQIQVTLVFKIK